MTFLARDGIICDGGLSLTFFKSDEDINNGLSFGKDFGIILITP